MTYPNVGAIAQAHPFPWIERVVGNGQVSLIDAAGKEVALFAITALCQILTKHVKVTA